VPGETAAPRRLVLIADPDVEAGKALVGALAAQGLESLLVHDGVEAILAIQRALPSLVVLEASLPKMFGFQVCELVKRNEQLRSIPVVLVGTIHHRDRYRRQAAETYGADHYLERPQLPEALLAILRERGIVRRRTEPSPPPPAPARPAAPPARPAPAEPEQAAEIARAERLARIIVSDIVLYNPERFEAAIRSGDVVAAMAAELEEGRAHFRERIPERIRERKDFLGEELVRVARQRGAR
jgi:CheY-like chemotaxis protein